MPTEREQDKYKSPEPDGYGVHNPELKHDSKPSFRLHFLKQAEDYMYSANPYSITIRVVVFCLALYGFIKLTNHIF